VPARQRLTSSQAEFFDHLPKQRLAAGPAQAAAAIQAYAGPVTEDRRELIISHGNLINWFVTQALDAPDDTGESRSAIVSGIAAVRRVPQLIWRVSLSRGRCW
jgi:hypothetical protein